MKRTRLTRTQRDLRRALKSAARSEAVVLQLLSEEPKDDQHTQYLPGGRRIVKKRMGAGDGLHMTTGRLM